MKLGDITPFPHSGQARPANSSSTAAALTERQEHKEAPAWTELCYVSAGTLPRAPCGAPPPAATLLLSAADSYDWQWQQNASLLWDRINSGAEPAKVKNTY